MDATANPPADSPEEALARYRDSRDPRDLGRLFDLAAPDLFRVALHLCPDAAAAEDALQETFLAVMEHPERYEPGRPARPWLASILRHLASKGRRQGGRVPDQARLPTRADTADPLHAAADAEERERVRRAILDLEEPYREAALLRWRYGLEPAEIAEVKGVPPGTVSSWLHRAVEKLRVDMVALPAVLAAALPGRGLDAVRAEVVRSVAAQTLATAAAVGGGIVATKIAVGAAAVVLVATGGWWALRDEGTAPAPSVPPVAAPAPAPVASNPAPPRPHGDPAPVPAPPAPPAPVAADPAPARTTDAYDPALATAVIRVRARAPGTLPKMRPIKFDADPCCSKENTDPVLDPTIAAGAEGRLSNVVAWVSRGADRWTHSTPAEAVLLDQKGCMYVPHVFTMMVGQPLTIRNSDKTMHNVHVVPEVNEEFNKSQLQGAGDISRRFSREEVGLKFKCDVHGWMGAFAGIFSHPFHGVTGGDGTVTLRVPPGEYEVSAWHEYKRFAKPEPRKVVVASGQTIDVEFEFVSK